jgi:5-methylcytosine-specific restriction endonuclease McrA
MELYNSPADYMYNLKVAQSAEAKKLWRKSVKEQWDNECAYCGSSEDLTIDHIIPRSLGGSDTTKNVVCCCQKCNADKSHTEVEIWYFQKNFFSQERWDKIEDWRKPDKPKNLYSFKPRRNNAS